MAKKHILVISAVHPRTGAAATQAAEMITWEILNGLSNVESGLQVSFLRASEKLSENDVSSDCAYKYLKSKNVRILNPIKFDKYPRYIGFRYWLSILFFNKEIILRGWGQHQKIKDAFLLESSANCMPDAILPIWSYECTYASCNLNIPIYQLHGNPDHKLILASIKLSEIFVLSRSLKVFISLSLLRIYCHILEYVHLRVLSKFACIWENALNDSRYYNNKGLKNVQYVRNMWPAPKNDECLYLRDKLEITSPVKICGNLGHLGATANSFGIKAICEEIMPSLVGKFGRNNFELHLYGREPAHPYLNNILYNSYPELFVRGFVQDIEKELLSCPIFLLANNRYGFNVGHTRILHAFSTGACVVAYESTKLSMPELEHGHNILLAKDSDHLVDLIFNISHNHTLRRTIGSNALHTLRTLFNPNLIVPQMISQINSQESDFY